MLLAGNVVDMSDDYGWVADTMKKTVPWVTTAGVEFTEVGADRVVCTLIDVENQRNHVGGPHAAVMFGLAETASGAVGLASFAGELSRATPLVVSSEIRYRKLAKGDLTAEAVLTRPAAEVIAELDSGERPEFAVDCTIRDAQGVTTAEMTVLWTLKPIKRH
jgi:acyl-coenzyme A thioesterase PaaI-like protein